MLGAVVCMTNFDAEGEASLPRWTDTYMNEPKFCFSEADSKKFGKPGTKGDAKVEITNYQLIKFGGEAVNTAKLNKLIETTNVKECSGNSCY